MTWGPSMSLAIIPTVVYYVAIFSRAMEPKFTKVYNVGPFALKAYEQDVRMPHASVEIP